jgi:NAD-dependent dihydropyrimidine dehydrogenase PreA subunit
MSQAQATSGEPAVRASDAERDQAADPRDGAPVVVSVRGGQWRWTPATAVVVFGSTRDCGTDCELCEVMCPNTTFHASRDSAQAYLAGQILDQDAAVERGRRNFGPLLGGTA